MTNIKSILALHTKTLDSRVDAETLLQFVLNKTRSYLYTWPEKKLTADQANLYKSLVEQRKLGRPVSYITNEKEFYSRMFKVTSDTLIPRPDTELLIDIIIKHAKNNAVNHILELGTGTGIIAITLAKELNAVEIMATDISAKAIKVAKDNAKKNNANVTFVESNWFQSIKPFNFDLIVSNPPYIETNDIHLQRGDLRFEPKIALASGKDGLVDIKKIIAQSKNYLNTKGLLAIEHGYNQKSEIQQLFKDNDYKKVMSYEDIGGNDRVTVAQKTE